GGLVALAEIARQVAIGHEMEHADFHGSTFACGELIENPPLECKQDCIVASAGLRAIACLIGERGCISRPARCHWPQPSPDPCRALCGSRRTCAGAPSFRR